MQNQVQPLRARLEAELNRPAVLLVTSATQEDGKSVTAFGLATSFSEAGYRSVLIDANPLRPQLKHLRALGNLAADGPAIDSYAYDDPDDNVCAIRLVESEEAAALSLRQIQALTDQCRLSYDYTIVDGSDFFSTGLPALLAKCVDGVLIALRHGRRPGDSDALLVQAVEETGTPVLGVVLVESSSRKAFSARYQRARSEPFVAPGILSPGEAL